MALVYKSICNEADGLLVYMMHLSEKEIKYKVEMEKLMHKGYIYIAKARYIMGSTCVTKMQLPSESSNPIKPVATICRAEHNNHWVFHVHRTDTKSSSTVSLEKDVDSSNITWIDSVHNLAFKSSSTTNSTATKEVIDKAGVAKFKNFLKGDPKGLKKSKNAFSVDDRLYKDFNDELLDELSTDSESNGSLVSVTDPIRLFGILVPNTLKQAQSIFIEVVDLIGKCATIQSELEEVNHRYNYLVEVKNLIEVAAKEIRMEICKPRVYWTPSAVSTISCHTIVDEAEEEEKEDKGKEEEEVEKYGEGFERISVKSIRSVFYDMKSDDDKEEEEEEEEKEGGEKEDEELRSEESEFNEEALESNEWGSDDIRSAEHDK